MNGRECLHVLTGVAGAAWWLSEARGQANSPDAVEQAPEAIPAIGPPDPNTKVQEFKLPPKSCDTHTHIFGA